MKGNGEALTCPRAIAAKLVARRKAWIGDCTNRLNEERSQHHHKLVVAIIAMVEMNVKE